jgi:transcriptional regulator with XRE-family HTH domain
MTSGQPVSLSIPPLTVQTGGAARTLYPAAGVAIIGRDAGAAVRLDDEHISRWHVRLEPHHDGWQAIDTSINGMFVDGIRRSSVAITGPTTMFLGSPDGVAVELTPRRSSDVTLDESTQVVHVPDLDEEERWDGETDPGVVHAGRMVAARRNELELTQRGLAKDKIINAGTLIAFEKGRSWPRRATLDRLEKALGWPPETIARLRNEGRRMPNAAPAAAAAHDEATEVLTDTVRAPLMAETVELAMHTLTAAVANLPDPSDSEFTPKVTTLLADFRRLEKLAAQAAQNARGTPAVVLALSSVRRNYNDLMMRAARSPRATLGQRLYYARHRAELTLAEAANGVGLPTGVLEDAEAERALAPDAAQAIETLVAQLTMG